MTRGCSLFITGYQWRQTGWWFYFLPWTSLNLWIPTSRRDFCFIQDGKSICFLFKASAFLANTPQYYIVGVSHTEKHRKRNDLLRKPIDHLPAYYQQAVSCHSLSILQPHHKMIRYYHRSYGVTHLTFNKSYLLFNYPQCHNPITSLAFPS